MNEEVKIIDEEPIADEPQGFLSSLLGGFMGGASQPQL